MTSLLYTTSVAASLVLLCLMPAFATADQLTLDECLVLARNNNPALKVTRSDILMARETVRQTGANSYPRLDIQGGYTSQLDAQAMQLLGRTVETQQPNYAFTGISLNHTLYDFGRRDARQQTALNSAEAVEFEAEHLQQEILLQVIETYYRILEGTKNSAAAREELHNVEEHRRMAQALYESGSVTRNDLLQADVRLANARQKLLGIRNRVKNLQLRLNFLTGLPIATEHELTDPPEQPGIDSSMQDLNVAIGRRADLQALRKNASAADLTAQESRAAFYPELFARLSLDYLQNDRLREQAIYAATAGIRFNVFDGFASSATEQKALAGRSKAQQQLSLAEEQARLEIAQAANDLKVASEQITAIQESIRQGQENLRINRNRYQERIGTATDVLDAQTLLTQARTEYYRAVYDHRIAAARLRKALGNL